MGLLQVHLSSSPKAAGVCIGLQEEDHDAVKPARWKPHRPRKLPLQTKIREIAYRSSQEYDLLGGGGNPTRAKRLTRGSRANTVAHLQNGARMRLTSSLARSGAPGRSEGALFTYHRASAEATLHRERGNLDCHDQVPVGGLGRLQTVLNGTLDETGGES